MEASSAAKDDDEHIADAGSQGGPHLRCNINIHEKWYVRRISKILYSCFYSWLVRDFPLDLYEAGHAVFFLRGSVRITVSARFSSDALQEGYVVNSVFSPLTPLKTLVLVSLMIHSGDLVSNSSTTHRCVYPSAFLYVFVQFCLKRERLGSICWFIPAKAGSLKLSDRDPSTWSVTCCFW